MFKLRIFPLSPGRIFITSFILIISIGSLILSLPISRNQPIPFIDILFTATSTTCVTGLGTIPISAFSFFGKCIILIMIQIGGLGLITLSFFIASLFLNLGMASRLIAGELLEIEFIGKLKQFLGMIICVTLACETIGTLILYSQFYETTHPDGAFFCAIFHAISAFCNAGISNLEGGLQNPLIHTSSIFTIAILMFAGGIGFIIWYDFLRILKAFIANLKGRRAVLMVSLHTKITLFATILLSIGSGIAIWSIEHNEALRHFDLVHQIIHATFNGMSARGVGFSTIPTVSLSQPSLFIFLILMFIGAAPGSTGSGIKTTTFILFIAAVFSTIRNREAVEISERKIPAEQIHKVMTIVALGVFWVSMGAFTLLLLEKSFSFLEILFEAFSAFGNCGLSLGITPLLSQTSKLVLIITMLIGRVGALTLVIALRKRPHKLLFQYPEERVMIG